MADEGSLTGVDSEVVEEIVPLSEYYFAPLIVTLQYLHKSAGRWIFILENPKALC